MDATAFLNQRKIRCYKTKQTAINKLPENGVLANLDITNYFHTESLQTFLRLIKDTPSPSYYEYISKTVPVNLFFDIEIYKHKSPAEYDAYKNVVQEIKKCVLDRYQTYAPKFLILESHDNSDTVKNKKSLHIIVRMKDTDKHVYFSNVEDLKGVINSISELNSYIKSKIVDTSVYREGLFRTIHSSKSGENRPLIVSELSDALDDELHTFVTYTEEPNIVINPVVEVAVIEQVEEFVPKTLEVKRVDRINKQLSIPEQINWDWLKTTNGIKGTPVNCLYCLVNPGEKHSDHSHSSLFLNNDGSSIVSCFSHGARSLDRKTSKTLHAYLNVVLNTKENTVYEELVNDMIETAKNKNYKRVKNTGTVYQQVKPYAFVKYLDPMDFLNEIFLDDPRMSSNVNHMDNVMKYMKQVERTEFPFIKYDQDYIGFKNGYYNYVTCEFTPEEDIQQQIVVKKYIDQDFTGSKDTPLIDKVLDYQFEPDVRDFLYACIGRTFKIRDNFEFFIFLLGEPGCGKSLILNSICACFSDIGIFSKTFEPKYGLSYLYDKDIVVCDDLPENFHELLGQDLFQSIVSNGKVSTAVKNGDATQIDSWKNSWVLASNYMFRFKDKGQISRRTMTWKFEKNVYQQDPTIMDRIFASELPQFIYKCTSAYDDLLQNKHKSIWDLCPEYFIEQQEELKMERNPLYKFLMDNTRYRKDNLMLIEDVRHRFNDWIGKKVRTLDNGTFGQINKEYIIERMMTCKHCNKEHKKGCCEKYNRKDRGTRKTVRNLEFIQSENVVDELD